MKVVNLGGGAGGGTTDAWDLLGDTELSVAATSISLTGLAAHIHLFIEAQLQSDITGANNTVRFNNDSGSNYDNERLIANATSVTSANTTGASELNLLGATGGSKTFVLNAWVHNVGTVMKNVIALCGEENNNFSMSGGSWTNNVDQITRVDIIKSSGNYKAGSRLRVFGRND